MLLPTQGAFRSQREQEDGRSPGGLVFWRFRADLAMLRRGGRKGGPRTAWPPLVPQIRECQS